MRRLITEVHENRNGNYCTMRILDDESDDVVMREYDDLVVRLKHRSTERMAQIDREIRAGAQQRAERRAAREQRNARR